MNMNQNWRENMEREAWRWAQTHDDLKNPKMSEKETGLNDDRRKLKMKTELCRKFRQGACVLGSKCNYAHGLAQLRSQPKLCRLFLHNSHCPYGRSCRFLHSIPNLSLPLPQVFVNAPPPPTIHDVHHRMMQTTSAATNASTTTTIPTTSFHKDQPSHAVTVKSIFNKNQLQKNSRIYADWI